MVVMASEVPTPREATAFVTQHCSLAWEHSVEEMRDLPCLSVSMSLRGGRPLFNSQHILAIDESMRGGIPDRLGLVAMAAVSRSGDSSPAEGGGDGGAVGAIWH